MVVQKIHLSGIKSNNDLWDKLIKFRILFNTVLIASNESFCPNNTKKFKRLIMKVLSLEKMLLDKFEKNQEKYNYLDMRQELDMLINSDRDQILNELQYEISKSSYSLTDQIEKIVQDIDGKLLERTRLKRISLNDSENMHNSLVINKVNNTDTITNPSIFDDMDFYYRLVKDFVDKNNSLQTSHKNNQSNVSKHTLDVRATKKRRINYEPIPKLLNFMCPEPELIDVDKNF